jgi:hypothetical protein
MGRHHAKFALRVDPVRLRDTHRASAEQVKMTP